MVRKGPRQLVKAVRQLFPDLAEPDAAISDGKITVDGNIVRNPMSMVGAGSSIVLLSPTVLRGEAKLAAALQRFAVSVTGAIALDAGAAAGGFTRVLLEHGVSRVYAVDVGHGQLVGRLRQDPRVVNLEATNIADLDTRLVPDAIELISLDLSYLSLTDAVPQLGRIILAPDADLISLVKPMFELHLPRPPEDKEMLEKALEVAIAGIEAAGWHVQAWMESPVRGSRGAFEYLVHATRDTAY